MVGREQVLEYLPKFNNRVRVANWGQSIATIGNEIIKAHNKFVAQYDEIYPLFDTGDIYTTCNRLWDFCKYQLRYVKETKNEQSVRSPAGIIELNGVDCKHYSLFIGGVLDAIAANETVTWDWCYRLVSETVDQQIGHIFVVVFNDGKEIWVDPVMNGFNEKCDWTYYEDIL